MAKHTLYITFDGLSDPLGQSQILPYLLGLAQKGFHITVLSCEKKERLDKEEDTIKALLKNTTITWNYILYNKVGGFLTRLNYLRKIYSLAKKEHRKKAFRLVHCRSYLSSLIGLRLKARYRISFLFDMRGFWADERIDGNIWQKKNPLHYSFYRYFKAKEKQFLIHSDAIVSLTHAAVKIINEIPGYPQVQNKISVIPCCVNTSLFDPGADLPDIHVPRINGNEHLLIYTGSIGTWYYTKEMIDCVLEWQKLLPTIKLLVVTRDTKELETILSGYSPQQKQIVAYTSASYSQVPSLLKLAKASIFFIKPAYSKTASSPTKMAECWAMNLPIITNSGIGDNDLYFNDFQGGILINSFTAGEYMSAGKKYLSQAEKNINYRDIALNHFDTTLAIETYFNIYNSLINEPS